MVLLEFIGIYRDVEGFIGIYWKLSGIIGFYYVVLILLRQVKVIRAIGIWIIRVIRAIVAVARLSESLWLRIYLELVQSLC